MPGLYIFRAHILSVFLFPSVLVSVPDCLACVDFNRETQKRLKSTAAQEKECGDSRTEVSNCGVMNDVPCIDLLVFVSFF